jgi:hypothetical protein
MLSKVSDQVSGCYVSAEECARKAEKAFSAAMREDLLRLQASWLNLARSYEFAERLLDFSKENERRRTEFYGQSCR